MKAKFTAENVNIDEGTLTSFEISKFTGKVFKSF